MAEHAQERLVSWKLPKALAIPMTLLLVMVGWLIFRVEKLSDLQIFASKVATSITHGLVVKEPDIALATLFLFVTAMGIQIAQVYAHHIQASYLRLPNMVRGTTVGLLLVSALLLRGQEAPFIYFDF
jgi:alginate O-acetyltransferase complex protein AlgI